MLGLLECFPSGILLSWKPKSIKINSSFGLYEVDLTKGVTYGEENMLAYSSDVGAGTYIVLQINVTTEGFPNQLLVAEEHNGALRMYLLSYDFSNNTAFLIPFEN